MDYFKMFFPNETYAEGIKNNPCIDFELYKKSFNKKSEIEKHRETLQAATNKLFNQYYNYLLRIGKEHLERFLEIHKESPESINIQKALFSIMLVLYNYNLYRKNEVKEFYTNLFCFSGIKTAVDDIEKDKRTFFINKFAIINVLENFFKTKVAILYIDSLQYKPTELEKIPFKKRNRYYEILFKEAITFLTKKDYAVKQFHPSNANFTQIAMREYYSNYLIDYNILDKFFMHFDDGHGSIKTMEAFKDFQDYQKKTLSLIYMYIVTQEEFEGKKDLFKHTWHKKLLMYDLLTQIDLKLNLPETYKDFTSLKNIKTKNFNDFKRDKVSAYFGK